MTDNFLLPEGSLETTYLYDMRHLPPDISATHNNIGTNNSLMYSDHKVHGTLLQRLWYLLYLDGALLTVVCPPSNIATYCCILLRLSLQCFRLSLQCFHLSLQCFCLPLQCSAFHCNIVFCPPLQFSSLFRCCTIHGTWCVRQKYYTLAQSTIFHCNLQCFSSHCNILVPLSRTELVQCSEHG